MKAFNYVLVFFALAFVTGCEINQPTCDVVIQGGTIYNGTGEEPFKGTVAILNDKIIYVGKQKKFKASQTIDATGKAIAPGFINMLSWAYNILLKDVRSLGDIKQGVTLEVFGEGVSPGPKGKPDDENYISFGAAMDTLIKNKVSTNIASFLGAATVRIQEIGYENREATPKELHAMQTIVKDAMEEGAMGIGSFLIYAPGDYANKEELVALSKIAAQYGGMYISHMRNENNRVLEGFRRIAFYC